jgi:choline dehydrogenase-like flavoprotein
VIKYTPVGDEKILLQQAIRKARKALGKLGCVAPPQMIHVRPMGASAHYSGTIPMSEKKASLTTSPQCQSHDFDNLFIVDGTTFPFLPAKNLTFTLMANAVRVAECAF